MALRTQNPLSKITINPLWKQFSQSLSNSEVVLPPVVTSVRFSVFFLVPWGLSFPSFEYTVHMILFSQQHMEWYSLPSDHGLRGTNIYPGQVYLFVHGDIDLSRQLAHPNPNKIHVTIPCINQIMNVLEPIFIGKCFRFIVSYCTK